MDVVQSNEISLSNFSLRYQLTIPMFFAQLTQNLYNIQQTNMFSISPLSLHNNSDVFVLPQLKHVMDINISYIITAADIVNHIIKAKSFKETLNDSIHAPILHTYKLSLIINLLLNNLKHKLNQLAHIPCNNKFTFILISAFFISDDN